MRSVQTVIASIKEGPLSQKGGASLFEGGCTKTEGDTVPCYDALAKALLCPKNGGISSGNM